MWFSITLFRVICKSLRLLLVVGFFVSSHKASRNFLVPIRREEEEEEEGRAAVSQPSASIQLVRRRAQQQRATLTMALAASRTLLALFLTFCAPGCGLTGKEKKPKVLFYLRNNSSLSRCTVCTDVFYVAAVGVLSV